MVVLIKDKVNGTERLEKNVVAITLNDGNIELIYDEEVITDNAKYPIDRYEVVKIKRG